MKMTVKRKRKIAAEVLEHILTEYDRYRTSLAVQIFNGANSVNSLSDPNFFPAWDPNAWKQEVSNSFKLADLFIRGSGYDFEKVEKP